MNTQGTSGRSVTMGLPDWQPIETAPRDGTRILGRRAYADRYTGRLKYERHKTFWCKTSPTPIYPPPG